LELCNIKLLLSCLSSFVIRNRILRWGLTGLKVGHMKIKVPSPKAEYWKSLKRRTSQAEFVK